MVRRNLENPIKKEPIRKTFEPQKEWLAELGAPQVVFVCILRFGHNTADDDASIVLYVHCCCSRWYTTTTTVVAIFRVRQEQSSCMRKKGVIQKGPHPVCPTKRFSLVMGI